MASSWARHPLPLPWSRCEAAFWCHGRGGALGVAHVMQLRSGWIPKPGAAMDRGIDFLKSQVNNAVMLHEAFVRALEDHETQAEDPRFRDLCTRFIPRMREHQRLMEDYQLKLGSQAGVGKRVLGKAFGVAR